MPWRIEIWVESSAGQVKLPVDSFIDCSQLHPEDELVSGGQGSKADEPRGICVVAFPSLKSGEKRVRPIVVPEDATLYACLTLANLPIDRRGRTTPPPKAGGGFPFTNGSSQPWAVGRGEQADSASYNVVSERFRAMTHVSRKQKGNRPRHTSDAASDPETGESFGGAFAEASNVNGPAEEAVMPLSDANFWIKCPPLARMSSREKVFSVCPADGAATFSFGPLGDVSSMDAKWDEDASPGRGEAPMMEAVHRTVNPLLNLKKSPAVPPPPPKTDLPPPLLLTMVRFNLELVPHRFASPSIPVHLLGELSKTETGAQAIASMNVIDKFVTQIKNENLPSSERRAALWALGHIGASEHGFRLLNVDHVRAVIQVAVEDPTLSMRGTAVYALGLFSRSKPGSRTLAEHGWATLDAKTHPFATIAVPAGKSASRFYKFDTLTTSMDVRSGMSAALDGVGMPVARDGPIVLDNPETDTQKALNAISELSNHIAQKDAHAVLVRIKDYNPNVFADVKLYMAAHELLAKYAYQLPVRQFITGLFHSRIRFDVEKTWSLIDEEHIR